MFKADIDIHTYKQIRVSIVVSIPACHAGDPGSIPGHGAYFYFFYFDHNIIELINQLT